MNQNKYSGDIDLVDAHANLEGYFSLAEQVDVVLAFKLHAVVLAHCVGSPTISLGYREKCFDYMESMDLSKYCHRTDQIDCDLILEQIYDLLKNSKSHQAHLHRSTEEYRERLIRAAKEITNDIP